MSNRNRITRVSLLSIVAIGVMAWSIATTPAAAQQAHAEDRAHVFATWSPDKIGELRKKFGLVGPGSTKPYPEPRFPKSLRAPSSVEDMMPGARAAVAQTSGRSPSASSSAASMC